MLRVNAFRPVGGDARRRCSSGGWRSTSRVVQRQPSSGRKLPETSALSSLNPEQRREPRKKTTPNATTSPTSLSLPLNFHPLDPIESHRVHNFLVRIWRCGTPRTFRLLRLRRRRRRCWPASRRTPRSSTATRGFRSPSSITNSSWRRRMGRSTSMIRG